MASQAEKSLLRVIDRLMLELAGMEKAQAILEVELEDLQEVKECLLIERALTRNLREALGDCASRINWLEEELEMANRRNRFFDSLN